MSAPINNQFAAKDDPLNKNINIRCSTEEQVNFNKWAKQSGLPLSYIIRKMLNHPQAWGAVMTAISCTTKAYKDAGFHDAYWFILDEYKNFDEFYKAVESAFEEKDPIVIMLSYSKPEHEESVPIDILDTRNLERIFDYIESNN